MTAARRPLPGLLIAFAIAAATTVVAAGAHDSVRMTAATNLTLRQTPNADATVLAYLPIGTEVTEAGPGGMDKTWLRVRLADNREGWLLANLTRVVEPGRRTATVEGIVIDRLGRRGDGPPAAIELADFIEREASSVSEPQTSARFDLYRLRAVSCVLTTIRLNLGKRDPYLSWLDRHKALIAYDEPGGRWILSNAAIWQIHDQHPDAAAADEIAWLGATNGLAGECGGKLVCYVDTLNKLHGEYLRRHPAGRHADEAVAKIKEVAMQLTAPGTGHPLYVFDRSRDCGPMMKAVDGLSAAVAASTAAGKAETVQSVNGLKAGCK
ncbi:MAG TPA: SH3 domain-containing protein [Vicinamibacterales bacterium]|nr:SH3 domain-containing protein [Vicinamibacterales bacterium]